MSRERLSATCCDHNCGQPAAIGPARLERNGQPCDARMRAPPGAWDDDRRNGGPHAGTSGRKPPRATGRGRAARSFRLRLVASIAQAGRAAGGDRARWLYRPGMDRRRLADRRPGSGAQDRATGGRRDGGGIPFPPGDCRAWLGLPASETVDRRIPLEAFWGADARAWPTSERGARHRRARAGDREPR